MQIGRWQMELAGYEDDIINAIHAMYEDEPRTEINCYRYLARIDGKNGKIYASAASKAAYDKLVEMQTCPVCGEILSRQRVLDHADEFGNVYVDVFTCPQCGEVVE